MAPAVGAEMTAAIALNVIAIHAPSENIFNSNKENYGPKKTQYLCRFPNYEILCSFSVLEDRVTSSQGAKSEINTSIRKSIRVVVPKKVLIKVIDTQRSDFLKRKSASVQCGVHMPPHIEQHIARIIRQSMQKQDSVHLVDGTNLIDATVQSQLDPSNTRCVVFRAITQTPL